MNVIVQGQGTYQRTDTPFSHDWSSSTTTHTINGTIYDFTATPASGWRFVRFEWVATYNSVYTNERGETETSTQDYSGTTTHNPFERTGANWTDLAATLGKICEYTEYTNYHGQSYLNYEKTETVTISSVTVVFEEGEGPTPPQPPSTVVVTFDPNLTGASVSPSSETYTADSTTTYGSLPTPYSSVDATFVGWFTAASGGTQVTGSSALVSLSNHTLYAHWGYSVTVFRYDVGNNDTVYLNGVAENTRVGPGVGFPGIVGVFEAGTTISISATTTDPNLQFSEWRYLSNADLWADVGTVVQGAGATYTLTVPVGGGRYRPSWTEIAQSVKIRAEMAGDYIGATISINGTQNAANTNFVEKVVLEGGSVSLVASETAVFNFYRFTKWTRGSSGGATVSTSRTYTFTAQESDDVDVYGTSKIFFAVYQEVYRVSVAVSPGGSGTATIVTPPDSGDNYYLDGSQVTIRATASAGFRFVKWTYKIGNISHDASTSADFTFVINSPGPGTYPDFTAHFVELKAYITFKTYYKNGDISRTVEIPSGSVSTAIGTLPAAPTYINTTLNKERTFLGWFTEEFGGTEVTSSYQVTGGQTYTFHAHWQRIILAVVRSPTCGWLLLTGVATQSGRLAISPVNTQSPAETSSAPASTVTCEGGLYGGGRIDGLRVTASNETGATPSAVVTDYTVGRLTSGVSFQPSHDDLRLFLRSYSLKLLRDPTTNLPLRDPTSGNLLVDA